MLLRFLTLCSNINAIGITQPPPKEGARSAFFSNLSRQLFSKAIQAKSFGGAFVILITVPY